MNIGNKLKNLRLKHNLTMQELADRCNLSKGFISQIENNLASPSIETLEIILDVFATDFSSFFSSPKITENFVFRKDDIVILDENDYDVRWLVPNSHKLVLEPIMLILKPNKQSKIIEPFSGEIFGYVISGSIYVHYGNKTEKIKENESFYIKGNAEHYLVNYTNKNAQIIWVSSPPIF